LIAKKEPGDARDYEHDDRRDAPATVHSARPPSARQDEQRRDYCDEEKDSVQVHDRKV
jgi:hypothetical protein